MNRTHTPIVTIFGASGFVGSQLVRVLARKGYRIRAAERRPDLAINLRPLGDVGQIVLVQANVRYPQSVMAAVSGADIVINLVAVGYERGAQSFDAVNVEGARTVAAAAKAAGVSRFVQMSMLGADPNSPSAFARSRAAGEAAVQDLIPDAVIIRPSIIFGIGDGYISQLASMARMLPVLPLIGGKTRFQPVYVGDVADAIAGAASEPGAAGQTFELGGPEVLTQRELLHLILHQTMRSNPLLPLPAGLARLLALAMRLLPRPLLTADQVTLLQIDNVVSDVAQRSGRTLEAFGVTPTPMLDVLPTYLWRFRRHGQFDTLPA